MSNPSVEELTYKLFSLGFVDQAYSELLKLSKEIKSPEKARAASRELALFHANKRTKKDAKKALKFLEIAAKDEADKNLLRKAAILQIESLCLLGKIKKAKLVLDSELAKKQHPHLFLIATHLYCKPEEKLQWINRALETYGIPKVSLHKSKSGPPYDRLFVKDIDKIPAQKSKSKVSVIMSSFNDESIITTAIEAVLNQTWHNIELIIVDDCSTDNTPGIIKNYSKTDDRIKFLSTQKNSGTYVARNIALREATGDLVTFNDSDDWTHPDRIATQAIYMQENKNVIATRSEQIRLLEDLTVYRRNNYGNLVIPVSTSFMFRRKKVIEKIGYYDSVRLSADIEYMKRVEKAFGLDGFVTIKTGPLSMHRQTGTSLTGMSYFGYHGHPRGVILDYRMNYGHYHATSASIKYPSSPSARPFPAAEPMLPKRKINNDGHRSIDIVIGSDYTKNDISTEIDLIKKCMNYGDVSLVQLYDYEKKPLKRYNEKLIELLYNSSVDMLVYGENVQTKNIFILDINLIEQTQEYIPDLDSEHMFLVSGKEDNARFRRKNRTIKKLKKYNNINYKTVHCYEKNKELFDALDKM